MPTGAMRVLTLGGRAPPPCCLAGTSSHDPPPELRLHGSPGPCGTDGRAAARRCSRAPLGESAGEAIIDARSPLPLEPQRFGPLRALWHWFREGPHRVLAPAYAQGRRQRPLALVTALTIGGFAFLALALVMSLFVYFGRVETSRAIAFEGDTVVRTVLDQVDDHMAVADETLIGLRGVLEEDPASTRSNAVMGELLKHGLIGPRQIAALSFVRTDGRAWRAERGTAEVAADDIYQLPELAQWMDEARRAGPEARGPSANAWSLPRANSALDLPVVMRRAPVWDGDRLAGLLVASVSLAELSSYAAILSERLSEKASEGTSRTAFILFGRDLVLAHPRLGMAMGAARLPSTQEIGDPVLARMWDDPEPVPGAPQMRHATAHWNEQNGDVQVFIYAITTAFGPVPWTVGAHFNASDGGSPVDRFQTLLFLAITATLVVTGLGMLVGRRMSQPFSRFSAQMSAVTRMNLAEVMELPRSSIREVDQASQSFNAMVGALRRIERHLPGNFVDRLVRGRIGEPHLETASVTVLFTDIAGFTQIAEALPAEETAQLLADHYADIARAVTSVGGTIDKFVGDGVMTYWSEMEHGPDHAAKALSSIAVIRKAIARRNAEHAACPVRDADAADQPVPLPRIQVRYGLHSGTALVGEIGESRLTHTVIGDVVNVADRLQKAAKDLDDVAEEGDVKGYVSSVTIDLAETSAQTPCEAPPVWDCLTLPGRMGTVDACRV
ncbi:MAG: adenylate/guanylate cyclase domain-containing protein [Pseudomonadota bacterium]